MDSFRLQVYVLSKYIAVVIMGIDKIYKPSSKTEWFRPRKAGDEKNRSHGE